MSMYKRQNPFTTKQSPFSNTTSRAVGHYDYPIQCEDRQKNQYKNIEPRLDSHEKSNPFSYFQLHGKYQKKNYHSDNVDSLKRSRSHNNFIFAPTRLENRAKLFDLDQQNWKRQKQHEERYKLQHYGAQALRYSNYSTATPSLQYDNNTDSRRNQYQAPQFNKESVKPLFQGMRFEEEQRHDSPYSQRNQVSQKNKKIRSADLENQDRHSGEQTPKLLSRDTFHNSPEVQQSPGFVPLQLPKFNNQYYQRKDYDNAKNSDKKRKNSSNSQLNSVIQCYEDYPSLRNSSKKNIITGNQSKDYSVYSDEEHSNNKMMNRDSKYQSVRNFYDCINQPQEITHTYLHKNISNSNNKKRNPYDSYMMSQSQDKNRGPLNFQESQDQRINDSVGYNHFKKNFHSPTPRQNYGTVPANRNHKSMQQNQYPEMIFNRGQQYYHIDFI